MFQESVCIPYPVTKVSMDCKAVISILLLSIFGTHANLVLLLDQFNFHELQYKKKWATLGFGLRFKSCSQS